MHTAPEVRTSVSFIFIPHSSAGPAPPDEKAQPEENYQFVDEPPDDYFCPVLTVLLLEPYQTKCCGNHISEQAVNKLKQHGRPCPLCNKKPFVTMKDNHFRRQVRELPVFCSHRDQGCEWVSELSALENHLDECPMKFGASEKQEIGIVRFGMYSSGVILSFGFRS